MDSLILFYAASGGIEFFLVDAFFICLAFISYLVRVFAYKKLLNTYFGLIPIFGDIVCMRRIGLEFKNSYTSRYSIFGVLSKISLSFFTIVIRLLIGFLAAYFLMGILSFFKPSEETQKYSYFYKRVKRKSKFVLVFAENVLLKQGEKGRLIWNR